MTVASRDHFEQHVAKWTEICRRRGRKWWPSYAYHFTDVQNAASILQDGRIFSRALAYREGRIVTDSASSSVISETPAQYQEYARLYFRPRTPTQYRNEGVLHPEDRRYEGAHCPVPIFFCFDLVEVLSQPGTLFSDGSMGRSKEARYGDSLDLFGSIPFDLVYHDEPYDRTQRAKMNFHRHAEILVPNYLRTESLLGIACRSDAERQTLISLAHDAASEWEPKIRTVGDPLFYRRALYIISVHSEWDHLVLRLHLGGRGQSRPALVKIEVTELDSGRRWTWAGSVGRPELRIQFSDRPEYSMTKIWVHGALAYQNTLDFTDDIPF